MATGSVCPEQCLRETDAGCCVHTDYPNTVQSQLSDEVMLEEFSPFGSVDFFFPVYLARGSVPDAMSRPDELKMRWGKDVLCLLLAASLVVLILEPCLILCAGAKFLIYWVFPSSWASWKLCQPKPSVETHR